MPTMNKAPSDSLFFAAGSPAMEFGTPPVALAEKPVTIVARTRGEAQHGFWGRCVHDFSGMIEPAGPIGIDFAHDDSESIGVCETLSIEDGQLIARGKIVPFTADDQASRVIFQGSKGIPFQSSIRMATAGLEVEQVPAGETVEVNGGTFTGPGNVFRKWGVEGIAVLNYGSDASTSVHFSRGKPEFNFSVSTPKESKMPETKIEAEVIAIKSEDTLSKTDAMRFKSCFGAKGIEWFFDGKSFDESVKLFGEEKDAEISEKGSEVESLKAEIEKLKAELEAAKGKADFRRGQAAPVPVTPTGGEPEKTKTNAHKFGRTETYQAFVEAVEKRMPAKK